MRMGFSTMLLNFISGDFNASSFLNGRAHGNKDATEKQSPQTALRSCCLCFLRAALCRITFNIGMRTWTDNMHSPLRPTSSASRLATHLRLWQAHVLSSPP